MDLRKDAMILNIQIGIWLGYRLDKETTRKVTEDAGSAPDAARVNKHLVPKESLSEVVMAANGVRSHFWAGTLPWKDNGDRLIVRQRYMKFIEEHENLVGGFNERVGEFIASKYPTAMEQAEFRMGALFNPADYPSANDLRRRFYINLDIDGVATAYDYRLETNDAAIQARVTKAMADLWARLAKPLEHFADKMGSDEIFRDTTINNLRDIVAAIPEFNFADDPNLERIRQEIDKTLLIYQPADLRKDKDVRAVAADQAKDIMSQMAGFMRAFGHEA